MVNMIKKVYVGIISVILLTMIFLPLGAKAATPTDLISITHPQESASIVNDNIQIDGKAPASTIVTVVINDTDTNRSGIVHQSFGQVSGTATSDTNGNWTFIPVQTIVPGQFSVQASFTDADNKVINSNTVAFVVVNSQGSSIQISTTQTKLLIVPAILVGVIVLLIILIVVRRRRKKRSGIAGDDKKHIGHTKGSALFGDTEAGKEYMQEIEEDTEGIAEELHQTAEHLENTNLAVSKLQDEVTENKDEAPAASAKNKPVGNEKDAGKDPSKR